MDLTQIKKSKYFYLGKYIISDGVKKKKMQKTVLALFFI